MNFNPDPRKQAQSPSGVCCYCLCQDLLSFCLLKLLNNLNYRFSIVLCSLLILSCQLDFTYCLKNKLFIPSYFSNVTDSKATSIN